MNGLKLSGNWWVKRMSTEMRAHDVGKVWNKHSLGTSLVVQWLGLCVPDAGPQFCPRELNPTAFETKDSTCCS